MSWSQTVLAMELDDFIAFAGFTLFAAGAGFWGGWRGVHRARLIEDVPTAKIRSAHQGYVELDGTARALPGLPILAPLSGVECCWWQYEIERRSRKSWVTVEKGESDGLFLVEDDTGRCIVDPEGASVTSTHKDTWYGSRQPPAGHGPLSVAWEPPTFWKRFSDRTGIHVHVESQVGFGDNYRYTESVILDGDPLYAVGRFKTLDEIDFRQHRDEIQRGLLRAWKQDPAKMAEFDRDGDGKIDVHEWEAAQRAAAEQAAVEHAEQVAGQHPHTLSRPDKASGRPYLLANMPQDHLIRRYRFQGRFGLSVFLLAGTLAVSLLTTRFLV